MTTHYTAAKNSITFAWVSSVLLLSVEENTIAGTLLVNVPAQLYTNVATTGSMGV